MKKLILINLACALFAFATSIVQTHRIIKNTNKFNMRNFLFLTTLAIFAAGVSVFQSNVIIKKITQKIVGSLTNNSPI
ncbi:hypothetical protein SAMN05216389_101366 [Oceanobacillus limi]|uniref:Uncharacterized protein n=1 Tax=Oceanobacillus limi TaxID=930131 RepID=A0A1H9YGA8_9BACI|nr:hypothetical protein [Oceanobacillus limi]SES67617.1 hypothetical protein SAMN05216389_101366 [Oceanobacillus limi]